MPTDTITAAGAGNWTPPEDVHLIVVKLWGAGGGGGASHGIGNLNGGAGAGAGAFSQKTLEVRPGVSVPYSNGLGGSGTAAGTQGSTAGGDTWFVNTATALAKGGARGNQSAPGAGGLASQGVGDVKFDGGDGFDTGSGTAGGGGGGAAGDASDGTDATSQAGASGGSAGGGAGGTGGNAGGGGVTTGTAPGGAGAGGGSTGASSAGGNGRIEITYTADVIHGASSLMAGRL